MRHCMYLACGAIALAALWTATQAHGQSRTVRRYYPLDQNAAPGLASRWSSGLRDSAGYIQPVRFDLPGEGQVSFFSAPGEAHAVRSAPALVGMRVGTVYRVKISDLADFPGVELYPSVELIDRLHPPRGRQLDFPVPITLTEQELRAAAQGRMVTKVIYLEQPDRAEPVRNNNAARSRLADPQDNTLAIADHEGRPMAIVRMGGRIPDNHTPDPEFWGLCEAVHLYDAQAVRGGGAIAP
jgi:hypothetical protein